MPQINRYLYFEIDDGTGPIKVVGDKYVPVTISLTGPNKVEKRYENITTSVTPKQVLSVGASGDIASYSFFAFRSSVAGYLAWEGTASGDDTSSIEVRPNEWLIFLGNDTTQHSAGDGSARALAGIAASQAITGFWFSASAAADVDVLAYS